MAADWPSPVAAGPAAGGRGGECDAGQPSSGRTGQKRCAALRQHPPNHAGCRCAAAAAKQRLLALIDFCEILLGLGVHAGMLAAVPAQMAGRTWLETADLRCGGVAAGAAVALVRLEQWDRLARRNSGGRVGSVGLGSVGRARRWRRAGCRHGRRPAAALGGTGAAAAPLRLPVPAARPLCCVFFLLSPADWVCCGCGGRVRRQGSVRRQCGGGEPRGGWRKAVAVGGRQSLAAAAGGGCGWGSRLVAG